MNFKLKISVTICCVSFLFASSLYNAFGQKISQIQEKAIQLPSNYKIDGTAAEWNYTFVAYNKSLGIYYTIANDNDKIYLILHSQDQVVIDKIINLGVTFIIEAQDKLEKQTITFPTYPAGLRRFNLSFNERKANLANEALILNDSLKRLFNKQIHENSKNIFVDGFNGFKDSLISIYNTQGIRAEGNFDSKLFYTYELAIPLRLIATSEKLNYSIQLNGVKGNIKLIQVGGSDRIGFTDKSNINYLLGMATPENYAYVYPSILSGTYTLFK